MVIRRGTPGLACLPLRWLRWVAVFTAWVVVFMSAVAGVLSMTATAAGASELISLYGGERAGTSGGQFLRVPGDARGIAMGGGMSAAAEGAAAIFWNPAAMITVKSKHRVFLNHTEYAAGMDVDHLAYVHRIGSWRLGLMAAVLRSGDIVRTTELHPTGQGFTFTANQVIAGMSLGRQLTDRFTVAASAKFLQENLDEYQNRGVFIDLGALYYIGFKAARIGFTVQNFGGDLKINGTPPDETGSEWQNFSAPTVALFGLAYDFGRGNRRRLTLSFDFRHPSDEDESVIFGGEVALLDHFALRGGWKSNIEQGGLSAGFGLNWEKKDLVLRLGYSYEDVGAFGGFHTVSLEFGR